MAKKKTAKKKTSKKVSKKTAPKSALPQGDALPEGFNKVENTYASSWDPNKQKMLQGRVTGGVRSVNVTINGEPTETRCMEITQKKNGERVTVWESAMLAALFDEIVETGEGPEVFIRYDGLGEAKEGQNAPKMFTCGIKASNPF